MRANITPDGDFKKDINSIRKKAEQALVGALVKFHYRRVDGLKNKYRKLEQAQSRRSYQETNQSSRKAPARNRNASEDKNENKLAEVLKANTHQFALAGKSKTHALVFSLQIILEALDQGDTYARIFFTDFSKGFDLVNHNILIQEIELLGVHEATIRWIGSFLTDRLQRVRIGQVYSQIIDTTLTTPTTATTLTTHTTPTTATTTTNTYYSYYTYYTYCYMGSHFCTYSHNIALVSQDISWGHT